MKKLKISTFGILATIYALPVYAAQSNAETLSNYNRTQDNSELRLALAKVALYSETNELDKAFELIDDLNNQYPNNTQVLLASADLSLRVNNRSSAFDYINRAHRIDPTDEDIMERQRSTMSDHGPFASLGFSSRDTNQATEIFTTAEGSLLFSRGISAEALFENNNIDSKDNIVRENGVAEAFDGNKQRAMLTLNKMFDRGSELSARLHMGNEIIGGGIGFSMLDRYGKTEIQANAQKPEWSFIETVIGNGAKDNIAIARRQHITTNLDATLELALNRYSLEHESNAASSRSVDFNIGYNYPLSIYKNSSNYLTLGADYTLGAEYFSSRKQALNPANELFTLLPAATYEVHSFTASLSYNMTPDLIIDGYAGYAVDRFGSDGPVFGGSINYAPFRDFNVELVASRGIMGEERVGTVDNVGMNFKVKW